jgi:hypothetical protein
MSGEVLERLLVTIEGSSELLRQELKKGSVDVDTFARTTQRNLGGLGSSFNRLGSILRTTLALFGVQFGARMFANFIKDAVKAADLTHEQRQAVDDATAAWKALYGQMQLTAALAVSRVSPAFRELADILRKGFFPTDEEAIFTGTTEAIKGLKLEVSRLEAQLRVQEGRRTNWLSNLFGIDYESKITTLQDKLGHLRTSISQMEASLKPPSSPPPPVFTAGANDFFGGGPPDASQMAFQSKVREEQAERAAEEARKYQERVREAQRITEQMATDVEKQVAEWNKAKALFDEGLLGAETLRRFDESQFAPITVTAKRMFDEVEDEGLRVAETLGAGFRDAFADWILSADHDFRDMLRRMVVELGTSALFKSLAGLFPAGGFLANFFGGGFAAGGRPPLGRVSVVGEGGPELFVPDVPGRILSHAQSMRMAAGGVSFGDIHVDARGATDPAMVEAAARRAVLEAVAIADTRADARFRAAMRPSIA